VNDLPGKSGHFKRTWLAKPPNLAVCLEFRNQRPSPLCHPSHKVFMNLSKMDGVKHQSINQKWK